MNYKQVCRSCRSDEVARLEWINVNTGEPYENSDPGVYTEWCFNCETETQIIEDQLGVIEKTPKP
jgi:hypothetical protein